nr:retrovirus-related Pol polyprotein from transposon TNT 1-94 [Tanacetum cinerariifolium]
MLTRSMVVKLIASSASECLFVDFLSEIEPKKVHEALKHPGWVDAIQEELNQFYRNKVWTLVPFPYGKIAIGSKWVFRNKKGELGTIVRSKARLANTKETHLLAVKRILNYLKGTPSFGLWYPKCSGFDLKRYSDLDYVGCSMDRKSTSCACQILGDPNPPINSSEARLLKEFIIKITVKNGQRPLTLDYKTFCESTRLDYNNGQYVDHPSTEEVKAKLAKIATNEAPVQKNTVLKTTFHVAWRILLTFIVQVKEYKQGQNRIKTGQKREASEARLLKEFIIKITVKNGQRPLTLDYKTFCESTRLDYNNGQYVDHPSTEEVKAKLAKIATNEAPVQKNTVLKTTFHVAWRILLTFIVQGEKANLKTKTKKKPKFVNVKKEPEHETQDTDPMPITVVKPTSKPTLEDETKIIGSSSRPQLTDPIVEVQIPEPETPLLTLKHDREMV